MTTLRRIAMMASALLLPAAGQADEQTSDAETDQQPPGMDILEFIGSWEGDDESWLEIVEMAEYEVERQMTASTKARAEDEGDEN